MSKKIYKRFPIKLWTNICNDCCMKCDFVDDCDEGCIEEDITCNQCEYGGNSNEQCS